jgi:hypothetical protein
LASYTVIPLRGRGQKREGIKEKGERRKGKGDGGRKIGEGIKEKVGQCEGLLMYSAVHLRGITPQRRPQKICYGL